MPSEETKVRFDSLLFPLPLTPSPQERILKVVEFSRVRCPHCTQTLADSQTDRVALRLDSHDHIHWLHQELAPAHVHQVRLLLFFQRRAHPFNRLISPLA